MLCPAFPQKGNSKVSLCHIRGLFNELQTPWVGLRPHKRKSPYRHSPGAGAIGANGGSKCARSRCGVNETKYLNTTFHSLGKGEVESSILSCSTIFFNDLKGQRSCSLTAELAYSQRRISRRTPSGPRGDNSRLGPSP